VRAISGLKGTTYKEKLQEVGLPTLEERRREKDLAQTFKIIRGMDSKDLAHWFNIQEDRRPTRGQGGEYHMLEGRSNHDYRRNFNSQSTQRVPRIWNTLPVNVKGARTINQFKRLCRRDNTAGPVNGGNE